jgi:hypothetical protein
MKPIKFESNDIEEIFSCYRKCQGIEAPPWLINHEKAHYQKAKDLGYSPLVKLVIEKTGLTFIEIIFKNCEISPIDAIEIALAPIDPSLDDLCMVEKNREKIKSMRGILLI